MEMVLYALFVIGFCILLIWLTGKTISDYKKGKATITQIVQAFLTNYIYFVMFFGSLISTSATTWKWIISAVICAALFFFSEWAGDWIGEIYRKIIKPYMAIYKVLGTIGLVAIVIAAYVLTYLTWKGEAHPGLLLSEMVAALILIIGMITGLLGYSNSIWKQFIKDRSEQEKKLVTVLSFILVWIGIGLYFGFYWHLPFIFCAILGIVVLMYFMIPAWVGENPGLIIGFLFSVVHVVSLLGVGALIAPLCT